MDSDPRPSDPGPDARPLHRLGHGVSERARNQSVLAGRRTSTRLVGAVGRASVGFGLAVGRARAIRPVVRRTELNSTALRPPPGFWRADLDDGVEAFDAFDDTAPAARSAESGPRAATSAGPRPHRGRPAARRTAPARSARRFSVPGRRSAPPRQPAATWTDQVIARSSVGYAPVAGVAPSSPPPPPDDFVPSGDRRLDELRLLLQARAADGGAAAPAPEQPPAAPAARRAAPQRPAAGAPERGVGGVRGDTAAGSGTGPGRLARQVTPISAVPDTELIARSGPAVAGGTPGVPVVGAPGSSDAPLRRRRAATPTSRIDDLRAALRAQGLISGEETADAPTGEGTGGITPPRAAGPRSGDDARGRRPGGRGADARSSREPGAGPRTERGVSAELRRAVARPTRPAGPHPDGAANTARPPARRGDPGVMVAPVGNLLTDVRHRPVSTALTGSIPSLPTLRRSSLPTVGTSGTEAAGLQAQDPAAPGTVRRPSPTTPSATPTTTPTRPTASTQHVPGLSPLPVRSGPTTPSGAAATAPSTASVTSTSTVASAFGTESATTAHATTARPPAGRAPVAPRDPAFAASVGAPGSLPVRRRVSLPRALSWNHRPAAAITVDGTRLPTVRRSPVSAQAADPSPPTRVPGSGAPIRPDPDLASRVDPSGAAATPRASDAGRTVRIDGTPVAPAARRRVDDDVPDGRSAPDRPAPLGDADALRRTAPSPSSPAGRWALASVSVAPAPIARSSPVIATDPRSMLVERPGAVLRRATQQVTRARTSTDVPGEPTTRTSVPSSSSSPVGGAVMPIAMPTGDAPVVEARRGVAGAGGAAPSADVPAASTTTSEGTAPLARGRVTDGRPGAAWTPRATAPVVDVDRPDAVGGTIARRTDGGGPAPVVAPPNGAVPTADTRAAAPTIARAEPPVNELADRFMTELSETVRRRPAPLPVAFRPMAEAITGGRAERVMLSSDSASRRALRKVGKVAATTDNVIHLAEAPAPSRRLDEVIAHELTHVANPSPVPRFFADDHDSPEERQADRVARVMASSPIAPSASTLAVSGPSRRDTGVVRRSPSGSPGSTSATRTPAPASSPGTMSAAALAASITGRTADDTVRRAPAPAASAASAAQSADRAALSQPPAAAPGGGSAPSESAPSTGRDADLDLMKHIERNLDRILDLIEDRLLVEMDRRGGGLWRDV